MKVRFRGEPTLRPNSNGHKFEITEDFKVLVGAIQVIIPKGFWTDLASTPRLIWSIYPPIEFRDEGVLHDWLYKEQLWNGKKVTRKQADKVLRLFVAQKHGYITGFNFYYSVRLSTKAKKAWNKYKSDREAKEKLDIDTE